MAKCFITRYIVSFCNTWYSKAFLANLEILICCFQLLPYHFERSIALYIVQCWSQNYENPIFSLIHGHLEINNNDNRNKILQ